MIRMGGQFQCTDEGRRVSNVGLRTVLVNMVSDTDLGPSPSASQAGR